jgi:hypothetical protein
MKIKFNGKPVKIEITYFCKRAKKFVKMNLEYKNLKHYAFSMYIEVVCRVCKKTHLIDIL